VSAATESDTTRLITKNKFLRKFFISHKQVFLHKEKSKEKEEERKEKPPDTKNLRGVSDHEGRGSAVALSGHSESES
jgi:hypothetical protein